MSCPFSNLFGESNTGVHRIRIFGFALVDSVLTIIAAYILSTLYKIDFWFSLLNLFILGEVLHYLFGVNTAFIKMIGFSRSCDE